MLPDNIYNSYLEYKKDTNTYIAWLCSTATSCGYTPPYKSSQGATASQPKSRKKKPEEREVSIKRTHRMCRGNRQKTAKAIRRPILRRPVRCTGYQTTKKVDAMAWESDRWIGGA